MNEFKLFVFILSILFILKNVFVFSVKIFQTDPEPMSLNKYETIGLYVSLAYILTHILY